MDPAIVSGYIDAFKASPALWRDQLTALLYGTAFCLTTAEGVTIYPKQFWQKVSNALDLLGAETGALLVRTAGQWQTLPPGQAGSVLTSTGPDNPLTWE
jgi:hypothetical protein